MPKNYKKLAWLVLIIIILAVVGVFIYNSRFRVVGATPNIRGVVSTSFNGFKLEFNRELSSGIDYTQRLDDPDKHVRNIDAEGSFLYVLVEPHLEDNLYKFSIRNIEAKDGSNISSLDFNYVARYVDIVKLSDEDKAVIQELSNRYRKDYPIVSHLPYSTLDFKLEAEFDHVEESAQIGELYLRATIFLSAADVKINKDASIEAYKKAVKDYIVSIGFNPDEYRIEYSVVEPTL